MKNIFVSVLVAFALFMFTGTVSAEPQPVNPNTVAYYPTGIHAIPTNPVQWFEGVDTVDAIAEGNFNQWFYNDEMGFHSLWKVMKNDTCQNGVVFVDPYPEWGDYLTPGANYCVMTNQFMLN